MIDAYLDPEEMDWLVKARGGMGLDPLVMDGFPILFGAFANANVWAVEMYLPGERTAFFMDRIDAENCPVLESARRVVERARALAATAAIVGSIDVELLDDHRWLVACQWRPMVASRR